jgi:hypothetical protein
MKENNIQNQIVEYINLIGGCATKVQSGSILKQYTNKFGQTHMCRINLADEGTSDVMGCLRGRFIVVEVKRDQEELDRWERQWQNYIRGKICKSYQRSIEQHEYQRRVRKAGGLTFAVCSVDMFEKDLIELDLVK